LTRHPDPHARIAIEAAICEEWLRVEILQDSPLLRTISAQLHRGEAKAIALAIERKAEVVLMDGREGRQIATQAGLSVAGVLGVLLRAKNDGQIHSIEPEIDALREKAHFFIARPLEARILAEAGESH
jgi:predicted nucleic acid-binding protein